ncbi:hypothetical protein WME97_00435 [Sorangium sp. So ce367]|uniref:hypothetical protein n=1 Tax=Sorangium sp. So ce367 TaxID=3133305 RepID=UPI003F633310
MTWADFLPTNEADCEKLFLAATLYKEVNGVMQYVDDQVLRGGYADFGGCMVGSPVGIHFTDFVAGANHRIVVTARTGKDGSFPTRKFNISTVWEPSI